MTLTIDIPDSHLSSINQFLSTQLKSAVDGETGLPIMVPIYDDAEDFVIKSVGDIIFQIVRQFPSAEAQQKLDLIQAKEQELRESLRPTKVQRSK